MKGLQAEDGILALLKLKSLAHFQSMIESKVFCLPTLSTIELINYSTAIKNKVWVSHVNLANCFSQLLKSYTVEPQ